MRVALISPRALGPDSNPGWCMITYGIRALVREALDDQVEFLTVSMLEDNKVHWAAAMTCDVAILCGNPRFTLSDPAWWETEIWHNVGALTAAGIRVIDGWGGGAYRLEPDFGLDRAAQEVLSFPRNKKWMPYAKAIHGRITRDKLMQRIYELAGTPSTLLPCSSYWARREFPVKERPRTTNAISLVGLHNRDGAAQAVCALHEQLGGDILASSWGDYLWARGNGLKNVQLANDPTTLLNHYSRYDKFAAFRVHAAIPAASMGCRVHTLSIDTRALICEPFGIPVTPWYDLGKTELQFPYHQPPDQAPVIATLKEMLCQ